MLNQRKICENIFLHTLLDFCDNPKQWASVHGDLYNTNNLGRRVESIYCLDSCPPPPTSVLLGRKGGGVGGQSLPHIPTYWALPNAMTGEWNLV